MNVNPLQVSTPQHQHLNPHDIKAQTTLKITGLFWFAIVVLGQWAFLYYIAAFYGVSIISGDISIWNRYEPLGSTPFKVGDTAGNTMFGIHALGAGIVAFAGILQLIPQVRQWAPRFHRWNGRVFLVTVIALSLSGFYLVWVRGSSPSTLSAIGTTINGLLILSFSYLTLARIRAKAIASHRRWALRLFLVANAQWFLRVGVFSYLMVGNALGAEPNLNSPFFIFWTFGCYLLPLAMLELFLYAKSHNYTLIAWGVSALVLALTLLMLGGIIGLGFFFQLIINGDPIPF